MPLTAGGGVGEVGECRVEMVPLVLSQAQSLLLHSNQLLLRLFVVLVSDPVNGLIIFRCTWRSS